MSAPVRVRRLLLEPPAIEVKTFRYRLAARGGCALQPCTTASSPTRASLEMNAPSKPLHLSPHRSLPLIFFSLSLSLPSSQADKHERLAASYRRARFLLRNRQPARTIRLRTTFTLRRATCLDNARWKCDHAGIDIITARSETMRGSGGGFSPSYS